MIKRLGALGALIALVCVLVPVVGRPTDNSAAALVVGRVHESFQPTEGKVFVLVIGSDARSGNPIRSRADAVHIVGINTENMKGGVLNFPRDSWVNAPGIGSTKLTEVLYHGGPVVLAKTLEQLTGIQIDYWVMTAFEGFQGIIKDLDGVKVRLTQDVYDYGSGAKLEKGTQVLGFRASLAYNRSRKAFSGGDVDRTTNQGDFLIAMLRKLRGDVARDPTSLLDWIATTRQHTELSVPAEEQFELGVLASYVNPKDVGNVTVPVSIGAVGAASVVFIDPSASSIYRRFRENAYL